jgi:hypothetical protein
LILKLALLRERGFAQSSRVCCLLVQIWEGNENLSPGHGAASSFGIDRPAIVGGGGIALAHQLSSGLLFSPIRSSAPKTNILARLARAGYLSRHSNAMDGSLWKSLGVKAGQQQHRDKD